MCHIGLAHCFYCIDENDDENRHNEQVATTMSCVGHANVVLLAVCNNADHHDDDDNDAKFTPVAFVTMATMTTVHGPYMSHVAYDVTCSALLVKTSHDGRVCEVCDVQIPCTYHHKDDGHMATH
uniref:Uncharacterized protein n=1 Tax=Lygus hesperus TaxID=30085 RepID=A0A146L3N1_LYGHE